MPMRMLMFEGYDFIHLICQLFCKLISVWKCALSLRDTVLQFLHLSIWDYSLRLLLHSTSFEIFAY